jgi:hypothetical protein
MKKLTFILCFYTINLFAQVPGYVPTSGLIGYWPFNGNANDVSGNGHNGTVNGAVLSQDRNGINNSAYIFNGTSDNILVPSTGITNVTRTTVSAWVKYTGNADVQRPYDTYFKFGNGITHAIAYGYEYPNKKLNLFQKCKGAIHTPLDLNDFWHHIVVVQDSNISRLYVDGVKKDSIVYAASNCYGGTNNLVFGADPDDAQWVTGYVDDIGFWNRALSQSEITTLYQGFATNIQQVNLDMEYVIYPNPITHVFNVGIPQSLENEVYTITDIYGKVLKSGELKNGRNMIDIATLSSGIYFIVFGNKNLIIKKIIKN